MYENFGKPGFAGNPTKVKVMHPSIEEVSYLLETPTGKHYEVAFFNNNEWVLETVEPFAEWAEPEAAGTRVYRWVPAQVLHTWLEKY